MKILSNLPILFLVMFVSNVSSQFRVQNDSNNNSVDFNSLTQNGDKGLIKCLITQFTKVLQGLESEGNQPESQNLPSNINDPSTLSQLLKNCLLEDESRKGSTTITMEQTSVDQRDMEEETSLSYSEEVAKKFQKAYGGGEEGVPPTFYQNPNQENNIPKRNDDEEESNRDPAPDLVYIVFESIAAHANQLPPTSLRSCLDGKSGRIILNFMLDIIGELNDSGFERVRPTAIAFDSVLPERNKACISNDPNFKNLKDVYNIHATSLPDFYEIITRVGLSKDFMKLRLTARRILIAADMEDFEGVGENAGKLLNLAFSTNKTSHDHFSY